MAGIPPQLAAAIAAKSGKNGPPMPPGKSAPFGKKPPSKKGGFPFKKKPSTKDVAQRIMQKKVNDNDADYQ